MLLAAQFEYADQGHWRACQRPGYLASSNVIGVVVETPRRQSLLQRQNRGHRLILHHNFFGRRPASFSRVAYDQGDDLAVETNVSCCEQRFVMLSTRIILT